MISLELTGLDEAIEALRQVPTTIGMQAAFESAAQRASAIVREKTPPGFTGKLNLAASYEVTEDGFMVGYSQGVEKAGNPRLDSARNPRTIGRSVFTRIRRWVSVEELENTLDDAVDSHSDEILSVIERSIADGLS